MKFRRVGNTGLKISEIALGSWQTYGDSVGKERSRQCLATALENGINFIDTADIYANGEAERVIGEFLAEETYTRRYLVISSKVYWAMSEDVNDRGLGRKHIMESIDATLERLNLDYLDIYFAHYFDRRTFLEESIGAMHDLVREGKAHYWGTSVFTAAQLERTVGLAKEMKAYPPKVEQPRYNMIDRTIELEIMETAQRNGMGITIWSPLYYGILTGKYNDGIPEDSRGSGSERFQEMLSNIDMNKIRRITEIASNLEITTAQLALSWILRREEISATITGATKPEQIVENIKASNVILSPDILEEIENILDNKPTFSYPYGGGLE